MDKNILGAKFTERERNAIAFALRRKGYLIGYFTWEIAATKALPELLLMKRNTVLAALREAAPFYPACYDAIRKLEAFAKR
jgi:hypothetical protein